MAPPVIKKPAPAASPLVGEFRSLSEKLRKLVPEVLEAGVTDTNLALVRSNLLGFHAHYEKINGNRTVPASDKIEIDDIRKTLAEFMERQMLPQISDYVLIRAPQPGAEQTDAAGDFILGTTLFRLVAGVIGSWGYKRGSKEIRNGLAESLLMTAQGFGNVIKRRLSEDGLPNLSGIVNYLIKMEILLWALEELQAQTFVETGRGHVRILARMALRRVCDLIERHTGRATKLMERDFSKLFAQLDDLIILTEKILDGEVAEREKGESAMAETIGKSLIDRFVIKMSSLLSVFMADTKEKLIADPTNQGEFETRLDQIEKLHDFATLVSHAEAPESLTRLNDVMRKETRDLASALLAAQRQQRGNANAEQALAEKFDLMQSFMTAHGWGGDASQLRVVQARMAGAPAPAPAASAAAGAGPAGASSADTMAEIQEKLKKLAMLLENGLISQSEYDGMRQSILARL